jgi:hypothetical protein
LSRSHLAALAFAAVSLAAPAAFAAASPSGGICFRASDWLDWKSPAPDVILLRVSVDKVYRLDLKEGSNQLKYPDIRLVNRHEQSLFICRPDDFDLLLSDGHGFTEPLFVKSMTLLTPDQVAAFPRQDRP